MRVNRPCNTLKGCTVFWEANSRGGAKTKAKKNVPSPRERVVRCAVSVSERRVEKLPPPIFHPSVSTHFSDTNQKGVYGVWLTSKTVSFFSSISSFYNISCINGGGDGMGWERGKIPPFFHDFSFHFLTVFFHTSKQKDLDMQSSLSF